mmetsp:Transcript_9326/g.16841  ORF Transcript_9326/g.16841 Transcript_9326/m.16841 type:complete len:219 (-) Transcript_9326:2-658(-)
MRNCWLDTRGSSREMLHVASRPTVMLTEQSLMSLDVAVFIDARTASGGGTSAAPVDGSSMSRSKGSVSDRSNFLFVPPAAGASDATAEAASPSAAGMSPALPAAAAGMAEALKGRSPVVVVLSAATSPPTGSAPGMIAGAATAVSGKAVLPATVPDEEVSMGGSTSMSSKSSRATAGAGASAAAAAPASVSGSTEVAAPITSVASSSTSDMMADNFLL